MSKVVVGCAIAAGLAFGPGMALAQAAASSSMASHSAMSSSMASHSAMASSAGHATETKTDMMMINQCHAMSHQKMLKDAECQDYMKHHPDWMKHK